MKKLKDFLYDKNDILIAFLILVVASLLIIWRMDAIMKYPETLISDSGDTTHEVTERGPEQTTPPGDDSDTDQTDKDSDSDASSGTSDAVWSNGTLSKAVEIKVSGASASEAVQCLVNAGLFKDYAEYQSTCTSLGLDHQKVSAGTFTFPQGSSKADVAKAVNWG